MDEIEKIKLTLHHNYLKIIKGDVKLHLPIRAAKIIKDMYNLRNAENETKDIEHYSKDGFDDPYYDVSVFIMNADYKSELQWITKTIEPINIKEIVAKKVLGKKMKNKKTKRYIKENIWILFWKVVLIVWSIISFWLMISLRW